MVMLGALSMDIYLPAVPQIGEALGATTPMVQLTLSLFMLTFGLGQLFLGPLTDNLGRRPVAVLAMLVFWVSTVGCTLAANIEQLIFWRCLAGLSACGCMVVAFAIVRDLVADEHRSQTFSFLTASIGLAPILAPIFGALMIDLTGSWRVTFAALVLFATVVSLVVMLRLPESLLHEHKVPFKFRAISNNYYTIIKCGQFRRFTFAMTVHMTGLFCFFSASPIIIISVLGGSKVLYSLFFACNAVTYTGANILSTRVQRRFPSSTLVSAGLALMLTGASLMLGSYFVFGVTYLSFLAPQMIIAMGIGMISGPGTMGATAPFGQMAGTATALLGAMQFSLAGFFGFLMTQFDLSTPLPLALLLMMLATVSLVSFYFFNRVQIS